MREEACMHDAIKELIRRLQDIEDETAFYLACANSDLKSFDLLMALKDDTKEGKRLVDINEPKVRRLPCVAASMRTQ